MRSRHGATFLIAAGLLAAPSVAAAQAAVASDLWRVAEGTLVVPAALADDGSAPLWTPAAALPADGPVVLAGIEAIHAPSEIGMNGGIASLAIRLGALGTLNGVYGRLGVDGLVRTETSPEGIGSIPVFAEVLSIGLARRVHPGVVAGVALRSIAGRLDAVSRSQLGVDVGVRYTDPSRVTLAFSTLFFDPTFRRAEQAARYDLAVDYRTAPSPMWGTSGVVVVRYGLTLAHGEGPEHLVSAGLELGGTMEMDIGAAREETAGTAVWRSRFGLGLSVGRYRVYLGRDGGVNAFGATYRFGLATGLP